MITPSSTSATGENIRNGTAEIVWRYMPQDMAKLCGYVPDCMLGLRGSRTNPVQGAMEWQPFGAISFSMLAPGYSLARAICFVNSDLASERGGGGSICAPHESECGAGAI